MPKTHPELATCWPATATPPAVYFPLAATANHEPNRKEKA